MSIEIEEQGKNKRGVSIYAVNKISKLELDGARFNIVEEMKKNTAEKLGLHLLNSLDIFKETENEDGLFMEARLVCIKEFD